MSHSDSSTTEKEADFANFKQLCAAKGLLKEADNAMGDDVVSGISDDSTLLRFFTARKFNVEDAMKQYETTRDWRDTNRLIDLYESIDISNYEETRKLYTHWTGRRDRDGIPLYLFEIGHLTSDVMTAYQKSCSLNATGERSTQTESEAMLRLFCTYENLTRFVLPLCSSVKDRPDPTIPVSGTTCIVDISGVGLFQFIRLRNHMQAASTLATAHYPETLGKTFVIGAPSFFPTVWGWINKWFDQNTVSKICIVPSGEELSTLSQFIDPANIPHKYGGDFQFGFGMHPELDSQLETMMNWSNDSSGKPIRHIPEGPMRWVTGEDGIRRAIAVGSENGTERKLAVMEIRG